MKSLDYLLIFMSWQSRRYRIYVVIIKPCILIVIISTKAKSFIFISRLLNSHQKLIVQILCKFYNFLHFIIANLQLTHLTFQIFTLLLQSFNLLLSTPNNPLIPFQFIPINSGHTCYGVLVGLSCH